MRTSVAVAALLVTVGCGTVTAHSGGSSGDGARSGIRGVATAGPTCPVQVAGQPCPDRPLRAVVTVTRSGSNKVVRSTTTGSDGRFSFAVDPGTYVLTARPTTPLPTSREDRRTVTVQRDAFSRLTLRFDTGIR